MINASGNIIKQGQPCAALRGTCLYCCSTAADALQGCCEAKHTSYSARQPGCSAVLVCLFLCPRVLIYARYMPALVQVRRWDVDAGANTDTLNASKAVYCVAAPPEGAGAGLVAFGGAERVLRLWDPRTAPGEALVRPCGMA